MTALISQHRRPLSALAVLVVMLVLFAIGNPQVFLKPAIYKAVFTSLPVAIFLTVPLVFVIVAGEIDLSFPSVMGLGAWVFALGAQAGLNPFLAAVPAILVGGLAGIVNGWLVTRVRLSSLVATLGMNFLLRGLIMLATEGWGIPLSFVRDTLLFRLLAGRIWGFPVQMVWALVFAVVGTLLFSRHKFGSQVCCVGDSTETSWEMGVNVSRVKTLAYVYVGLAAAFAGILSSLINYTFWPNTGEGYLLLALAGVFVGGTPTWGGVGTVPGAAIGAFIMAFIDTGIIAVGLTGFYTQFFEGLVLVLALVAHRYSQPTYG